MLPLYVTQVAFEELKAASAQRLQQRQRDMHRRRRSRQLLALLALAGGALWALTGRTMASNITGARTRRSTAPTPAAPASPPPGSQKQAVMEQPVDEPPQEAPHSAGWSRKWQPRWQAPLSPGPEEASESDIERVTVRAIECQPGCVWLFNVCMTQQRRRRVAEKVEAFEQAKAAGGVWR